MEISCKNYEFNELWDLKLNELLTEGKVDEVSDHSITFKLKKGDYTKRYFFGLFEKVIEIFDHYEVWTDNKTCAYGALYSFNGNTMPCHAVYAASKSTLNSLYQLEVDLRDPFISEAYSL